MKPRRSVRSAAIAQSRHGERRKEIANLAARMIAEDGLTDFAAAKQKAARQLGAAEDALLPDNHEIDAALREYQSIFQSGSQPGQCRALRESAAAIMRRLAHFSPWLVGSVLSGTANCFSRIELEIVTDDAKQVEMFFLNEGVPFELRVSRAQPSKRARQPNEISTYEMLFEEIPVVLSVYPHHAARFSRHSRASLTHDRAQLKDVEALLA